MKPKISLANLTSFGVGGRAKSILQLKTPEELVAAVKSARKDKIPFVVVAGGCNVVFPERLNKLVIVYRDDKPIAGDFIITGNQIECPASVYLNDLIRKMLNCNLAGMESMIGIPGTVGGAIYGNAGAFGQWIADTVERVEVLDRRGRIFWLSKAACRFGHKDSIFKNQPLIILRARFKFKQAKKPVEVRARAKEIIKIRRDKFKDIYNCCPGSFFKNVSVADVPKRAWPFLKEARVTNGEIPSGYLLELAGALGKKVGKIRVTDWHGNLIINLGGGTMTEVKKLSAQLKALVKRKFGVKLEEEVQYIK